MIRKTLKYKITGIEENNLKDLDFHSETGEVVVVSGVSGSGKSTLVNQVIANEAKRQSLIRRKTDDIYYYSIRPLYKKATKLPEPIIVSQRSVFQSSNSTFGTKTGINNLVVDLFVKRGEITHNGKLIVKPTISEIIEFRDRYFPGAKFLGQISSFEKINHSKLIKILKKLGVSRLLVRDESRKGIRDVAVNKLPADRWDRYEIFIDLNILQDIGFVFENISLTPFIVDETIELNCSENGLSLDDGSIFRLPSRLLFSSSTMSSLSGACSKCDGNGSYVTYDCFSAIDKDLIIEKGFLNVPCSASGRYRAFKYLPSGLANVLKKRGVDTKKSFSQLSRQQQSLVVEILNEKLSNNRSDPYSEKFYKEVECGECFGSGLSADARYVKINGKSIDSYFTLSASDLFLELLKINSCDVVEKISTRLTYLKKLSIDHIPLNRTTSTMSSGELQRLKLLSVVLRNYTHRIIVIDEPSSNLHYKDNIEIIKIVAELKARNNSVIIVDHCPIYTCIADRNIKIGPGSGYRGGEYCEIDRVDNITSSFKIPKQLKLPTKSLSFKMLSLSPIRNIALKEFKITEGVVTAIIGASGSGKSTLCRDLIYPALLNDEKVIFLDSKPVRGSSTSIVATYLNAFDKIRKFYSTSSINSNLNASDFSFNSTGACGHCNGRGRVGEHVCGVCLGSRFKPESALFKIEDISIIDLLNCDLADIPLDGSYSFLSDVIDVLTKLSLSHISLGRETLSLSGGELQRLKLARFMLGNIKNDSKEKYYVILDEPCRGLDPESINCLYEALNHYMCGATIIVIEHNPHFIYKCHYVVDMGGAQGIKSQNTIVQGRIDENKFPSLNHYELMSGIVEGSFRSIGLREVCGTDTELNESKDISGKKLHLLPSLLVNQKNFSLEKKYSKNFTVNYDNGISFFYKSEGNLRKKLSKVSEFYYNPFFVFLEKFDRVPESIFKNVVKGIDKNVVDYSGDVWKFRVRASSFEEAYVKGGGCVIVYADNKYQYHAVRFVDPEGHVVDKVFPDKYAFNLYKNSCDYCGGYGYLKSYPFDKWIKRSLSIFDDSFVPLPLNKIIPKATVKRFAKENLFDFSLPYNKLSSDECNILLYGFKAYKFKKNGKPENNESSYIEWRGLNSYIYRNAAKLSPGKDINALLEYHKCPFCSNGISKKSDNYMIDNVPISDFLD